MVVPPSGMFWNPSPATNPFATAPDTSVSLNGLAPSSAKPEAVSSTLKRPWLAFEPVVWFHRSKLLLFVFLQQRMILSLAN